ncbi:hypothetical protein LXL04_002140 [Taraxacum kok-saghyz]
MREEENTTILNELSCHFRVETLDPNPTRLTFVSSRVNPMILGDMGLDISSTICPLCNSVEEDVNHLFFGCSVAANVWKKTRDWWKVQIPVIDSGIQLTQAMEKGAQNRWFQVMVFALLNALSALRNKVIFKNVKRMRKRFSDKEESLKTVIAMLEAETGPTTMEVIRYFKARGFGIKCPVLVDINVPEGLNHFFVQTQGKQEAVAYYFLGVSTFTERKRKTRYNREDERQE